MGELTDFLSAINREMDAALDALVPPAYAEPCRLHEAVRWSLFAGGKRIRPAIVFAAGQAFGGAFKDLLDTAAAFEMIHTYSLIHDDLPAMDNDDLRRGKPTCHRRFDYATAILAGDVLQTLAYNAIAEDGRLAPDVRLRLIAIITSAAGTPQGMVAGQQLDLNAEGKRLTIDQINDIHALKTGALITAAAVSGAVIGAASDADIRAIRQYAEKLGMLFQVTDDLLDITQATQTIGKTAGKDISAEKATYPSYYGVEKTLAMADGLRDEAHQALVDVNGDTGLLLKLADFVLFRTR